MRVPTAALMAVLCFASTTDAFHSISRTHSRCRPSRGKAFIVTTARAAQISDDELTHQDALEIDQGTNGSPGKSPVATDTVSNTKSTTTKEATPFANDGPLSWMSMYLDLFGVKEGKSIAYGPIPVDLDQSKILSKEEAASRRQTAADNLQNIGQDERTRRDEAGTIAAYATVAFAAVISIFADDGGLNGRILRFMTVVPLFFTVGYKLSAKTGL